MTIGIGLIPTGYILNGYLRDQVAANVPNTLLTIQQEAIEEIEAQYLGLGITEVLPRIQEEETEFIKDEIVEVRAIPSTLQYLQNLSIPLFLERINGSMTANLIQDSLEAVSSDILDHINGKYSAEIINNTLVQVITGNSTTQPYAINEFFNNYTFQVDYSTVIMGVSEFATGSNSSLDFTATAQQRLLYGYLNNPGLIKEIENGTGILDYMEFYQNATIDPITYNSTMQTVYDSTWNQLTAVANYISNYLWNSIVPDIFNAIYGMIPSEYAPWRTRELFFNDPNWTSTINVTSLIEGISEYGTTGSNSFNYTSTAQQRLLYGYSTAPGLLENIFYGEGVLDYLEYYSETSGDAAMQAQYNATFYQLSNLTSYLTQYIFEVIIPDQLALEGLTLETAGLRDFYSQWANASIFPTGIQLNELHILIGDMLKTRLAANLIKTELDKVIARPLFDEEEVREAFFNNWMFRINFTTPLKGVTEYTFFGANISLGYTQEAQNRLLDGYEGYPGILTQIETGFGLLDWLKFYESARLNIGTNRTLMETVYNATWDVHLDYLGRYINDYIIEDQLAGAGQTGLEVGRPTRSDILIETTVDLWDPINPDGIVNETGIVKWYKAANGDQAKQNELNTTLNLTQVQFDKLYTWLTTIIKETLVPIVFIVQEPLGFRLTTREYAEMLFLEQWANGTIVPTGLDLGDGLTGFEVGIPIKSNISSNIVWDLFNVINSSSFIHNIGILKWIDAFEGDSVAENELIALFDLSTDQIDLILDWLFISFKQNVVPNVVFDLTGETLTDLAGFEFHRQWTNGTLFIDGIDLDPTFGLPILSDWELGIPVKSYITQSESVDLWGETPFSVPVREIEIEKRENCLIHTKGISNWFAAMQNGSVYIYLQNLYSLTDTQMDAVLVWLSKVNSEYSFPAIQEKMNLPTDIYTYANNLFLGFALAGGILLALGCLGVILLVLLKRK
ncbi:MAG: hypothetical protein ACFE88_08145 [Candidatus Hermodarchaeota archaeon]